MEQHLPRDGRFVAAFHDAAHDEVPRAGVDRALERDDIADLEAVLVGQLPAHQRAPAVAPVVRALFGRQDQFGIQIDVVVRDGELGEEVLRVAIGAGEPA
ncbi:hypothetical protein D3C87_1594000 [compost metagenome]